ncbi:MAG: RNA polymerase sigma factor [Candidatus Dormibacteria bacterium]
MPPSSYHAGDPDDFGRLYRESYHRVLLTLRGVLRDEAAAEDCTQEAYVRAFRAWPSWKPDAPAEAWVHRIAINVAISHRRRERLRSIADRLQRREVIAPTDAAHLDLINALRRLKPRHAAVIVLRHHHGYSNREIAAALKIPESTVSAQLVAAKRQLVQMLGERVTLSLESELQR